MRSTRGAGSAFDAMPPQPSVPGQYAGMSSASHDARSRALAAMGGTLPHEQHGREDDDEDGRGFVNPRAPPSDFPTIARHLSLPRTGSGAPPAPQPHQQHQAPQPPQMSPEDARAAQADAHIQNGIKLHERLELTASTAEFERAASLGNPTGMYLFGMALRSGWGVERDEARSFVYLSRAADLAMRQAQQTNGGGVSRADAAARELTLAIYELGQSFRNGWGVKRDRRTGAFYLQIAANLGDPDAQVDVATCYLNGDGVKRDKHLAAKYFRLAYNAGIDFPGNSWIWKAKYDGTGVAKKHRGP
ncbi:hypothetical protein H9P43_005108 [Blastocladiella emersonii ATCC 22665]|nr:hypothetical protein H9P43_005108 [Blastocladiella emersonii ATCC 22665]